MKLKDWLDFKRISVAKFCKYNDICSESIYGYIKGNIPRPNVAIKIFRATGGEVSYEELGLSQEAISRIKLKEKRLGRRAKRRKPSALLLKLKKKPCSLHPLILLHKFSSISCFIPEGHKIYSWK